MFFPHGTHLYRLRAGVMIDEYSKKPVHADWDRPELLVVPDAFIAQTSTSALRDATREQALESKSLYCDGSFDIAKGDRIFQGTFTPELPDDATTVPPGTTMHGETYSIDGIPPAADTSPFTGWTPPREIPLTRSEG